MKTLVVYCSRTGHTRKAAERIATALKADIEAIADLKDRQGATGYVLAGRDAMLKHTTPIGETARDPSDYDLVVIGTPVWAFTVAAPVRTYLRRQAGRLKRVAFFLTYDGIGRARTFADMEAEAGRPPVATLALTGRDLADSGDALIAAFARQAGGEDG